MKKEKDTSVKKSNLKKKLLFAAVVLVIIIILCFVISIIALIFVPRTIGLRGSGNVVTEDREVTEFDKIKLSGKGNLFITQGSKYSLKIEAEDNIIKEIDSKVSSKTLIIEPKKDFPYIFGRTFFNQNDINIYVEVKSLSKIETFGEARISAGRLVGDDLELITSGTGDIDIKDLNYKIFDVTVAGSANLFLKGSVVTQDISITGFGMYYAKELRSQESKIIIEGSGDSEINATERLEINISGSGKVTYYGNPKKLIQDISGAGSVEKG